MGIYGGIQLPKINEENLDDKKERKQILNYLALLDEKLRYMFQNIDIEENLSEESKETFLEMGQEIKNLVQDTDGRFSMLTQTVDGINTLVSDPDKGLSAISQKADSIESLVGNMKGDMSSISQKADRIDLIVTSGSTSGKITLTTGMKSAIESQVSIKAEEIDLTGYVTFSDLKTEGETKINGANITTGEIASDYIHLGDLMAVHKTGYSSVVGGYIGYGSGDDGVNASTAGIMMTDKNENNYFIATTSGVRMTYDDEYAVCCTSVGVTLMGDYDFRAATNFYCTTTGKSALGTSSYKWANIYATTSAIGSSDAREKNSIDYDMSRYEEFFADLKPVSYKFNSGTSDRFHVGFISQDIEENMIDKGLDSKDFAGFIKSPVYEKELKNGDPDTESEIVDYSYGLRYGEFVALNTHMIQKLMARVGELESKLEALS